MAATSASDVWAVGYFTADPADGDVPLTLHWDGTAWHQVPAPSLTPPDTLGIQLTSVSATSPSDAWAVGSSDAQHSTIVMHWDGNSWTTVPSPSPGGSSPGQAVNTLNGVVALSAGNVIAVGDYSSGVPGSATHSMVLQRNGSSWSQVSHPDPGVEFNFLNAVSAGPAGLVFAAGSFTNPNGSRGQNLVDVFGVVPNVIKDTEAAASDAMASAGLTFTLSTTNNGNKACTGLTNGKIISAFPRSGASPPPPRPCSWWSASCNSSRRLPGQPPVTAIASTSIRKPGCDSVCTPTITSGGL